MTMPSWVRAVAATLGLVASVAVLAFASSAARADTCPAANPSFTGPCGPTFTVPTWGDDAGWRSPDQYSTIQLADVLGNGRDQLIGRSAAGIEIWEFDTTLGQWRPEVQADGAPVILTAFADPPPLTEADPSFTGTDWTLPQYYSTIQTANVLGNGRAQILARSKDGMIVFSYTPGPNGTPGGWRQLTTAGPFSDADGFTVPDAYSTIRFGDGVLIGRSASAGLEVYSWNGSGWTQKPGISFLADASGGSNPYEYSTLRFANPEGKGTSPEVWYLQNASGGDADSGLVGERFDATVGKWLSPIPGSHGSGLNGLFGLTPWSQSPAYYQTLAFADITGRISKVFSPGDVLARGPDGLEAYQWDGTDTWHRLATLTALSDANGFNQDKYWRTIQFADIDGSGREEVLARGPDGLKAYKYDPARDSWSPMPGTLALSDDPWGSDPSYYTTIMAGDVTGDGRDAVIARGPYGIRTFFYDRPGVTGWSSYLPSGYPTFSTAGEQNAYAALNGQASMRGLLTGDEHTVRDVWTGEDAPSATDLGLLQSGLVTIGNCAGETVLAPPTYQSCTPPSGSTGFTPADWTAVMNEVFSELFDAQQVVTFFGQLNSIREDLFIAEGAELPAIGSQLQLNAAGDTPAAFNFENLFSGILYIASTVTGLVQPEVSAGLALGAEALSMIPSASPDATDTFSEPYSALQGTFATAVTQADKALASESQDARSDLGLLRLVGELKHRDTWKLDQIGLESAGREGFALWVYRTLLPDIWARYVISNCSNPDENDHCDPPAPGPWLLSEPNDGFESLGPPPASHPPCTVIYTTPSATNDCEFPTPPADIANLLFGKLSPQCAYEHGNANTAWTYGCDLGVDPVAAVSASQKLGSTEEFWNFPTYTGDPCITDSCTGAGSGLASMAGSARGVGLGSASIQLTGALDTRQRLKLNEATVVLSRVLYDRQGSAELVHRRRASGLAASDGSTSTSLGPVTLRDAGHGNFRGPLGAPPGELPPKIALQLHRHAGSSLSFDLRVSNVVLPLSPAACGVVSRRLLLNPPPVPLTLQLRIRQPGTGPMVISLTPQFVCRRDRLGAVRALVLVPPAKGAKLGPRLSITARGPHRFVPGRRAVYTATVRNGTKTTAYNVVVSATLTPGLRLATPVRGVVVRRGEITWQIAAMRARSVRKFQFSVLSSQRFTGRRCTTIAAEATLRRPAIATLCAR